MEVFNCCMECLKEYGVPRYLSKGKVIQLNEKDIDIDTYFVEMTCDKGHHTFTWLQTFKFEFLFDFAMREFVNEHYEAAIFYFGAAKERFYWFFVKVAMRKLSNDKNITDYFYKFVKKDSKMQEGIFLALYSLLFNKKTRKFDDNIQALRNDVIHNGNLITREDCEKYGRAVLTLIVETINEIKALIPDFYEKELDARAKDMGELPEISNYSCCSSSTECAIFLPNADLKNEFDKMVEHYNKNKNLYNDEQLKMYSQTIEQAFRK